MKLLHTSDWHLGCKLGLRKRDAEFEQFFKWLIDCIEREQVDVLLICGDIFDNSNPSSKPQELYYNFLGLVAKTRCHNVVVIAGNHDSPSLIDAPKKLLQFLNIFTIGSISNNISEEGNTIDDEVLILKDAQNKPILIVCAVPFLRERNIRTADIGEGIEEKTQKLLRGIHDHYQKVHEIAQQKRGQLDNSIPIIVMGHLFASGGKIIEGEDVRERELYVGNLIKVGADTFSSDITYVALGHLHTPQIINNCKKIRYSGSPLPMGFADAQQQKSVLLVDIINEKNIDVQEIQVPSFQHIISINGTLNEVQLKIAELKKEKSPVWVEIILNDSSSNIQDIIYSLVEGSNVEVLKITNTRMRNRVLQQMEMTESLDELNVIDVFIRCLEDNQIPEEERDEYIRSFNEILDDIQQSDPQEEDFKK